MRLELANYYTHEARFGGQTIWRDGVLEINEDEVLASIRANPLVESADIEIARPGESTRIVNVRDIIEPR
ncbi:MAG: hypothetical protein J4N99_07425, partial [Chloroflexi bacterium]|nr:hypothetical protein [Chloroflexota bacterium]